MFQFLKLVAASFVEAVVTAMAATFVCLTALWILNGTYGQGIDDLAPYGLVIFGTLALLAKMVDFGITMWLLAKRGSRFDNAHRKFYSALENRDWDNSRFWLDKMEDGMYDVTRTLATIEKWNGINKAVIEAQRWQCIDGVGIARRLRGEVRNSEWK